MNSEQIIKSMPEKIFHQHSSNEGLCGFRRSLSHLFSHSDNDILKPGPDHLRALKATAFLHPLRSGGAE
ncbi:unnamed protein product [Sphenostylis stenocarpa]|uniref:Uncharacterized protein n=1 Tax=Sphenostylis stenocarpa TaxID=92480 RepID=A0AA86VQN1_9FABA|nr:unnamed protein product [Sphenostylis stenocarpa]